MTKPLRTCPNCAMRFARQAQGARGLAVCPFCRRELPERSRQPKGTPPGTKPAELGQVEPKTKASRGQRRVRRLIARDGAVCWLCGIPLGEVEATLDHVVPRSKGGPNALRNLRLACRPCNEERGNADAALTPRYLTSVEIEYARELRRQGESSRVIAVALGRSSSSIYRHVKDIKVTVRKQCAHCGDDFDYAPQAGQRQLYCGRICNRRAYHARKRARCTRCGNELLRAAPLCGLCETEQQ